MNILILQGSPREEGNTEALTAIFAEEASKLGHKCIMKRLYKMDLKPCLACRNCQSDWTEFGCIHEDDMQEIFDLVLECDMIVVATPVYSMFCTPPMKTVLDRLVYGMNKYYGKEKGPSIWKGKNVALITTCGYPIEKGADLLEEGIKRYCKHSQLKYCGMLAERHLGYDIPFMDDVKRNNAIDFAGKLLDNLER